MIEVNIAKAKAAKRYLAVCYPENWQKRRYCVNCYTIYDSFLIRLCEECGSESFKEAICKLHKQTLKSRVPVKWWNPFTWYRFKIINKEVWKFKITEKELFDGS